MSILVENWPPVAVFDDVNLKMEYTSGTAVRLFHIDTSAPAYVPVYELSAAGAVVGWRMAMIPVNGLPVSLAVEGVGGLVALPVVADTGYDVYILVADDLSICAAIATVHGAAAPHPAGWGHRYRSGPIRYFCVNYGATNDEILPFVETAPRETFYCGIGANVLICSADATPAKEAIALATTPGALRKAQFPTTARSVTVQICASNVDGDNPGTLALFLNNAATALYTLPNMNSQAGNCETKTCTVTVPCHTGTMDTTDLMKQWTAGDNPLVDVFALGYQL